MRNLEITYLKFKLRQAGRAVAHAAGVSHKKGLARMASGFYIYKIIDGNEIVLTENEELVKTIRALRKDTAANLVIEKTWHRGWEEYQE